MTTHKSTSHSDTMGTLDDVQQLSFRDDLTQTVNLEAPSYFKLSLEENRSIALALNSTLQRNTTAVNSAVSRLIKLKEDARTLRDEVRTSDAAKEKRLTALEEKSKISEEKEARRDEKLTLEDTYEVLIKGLLRTTQKTTKHLVDNVLKAIDLPMVSASVGAIREWTASQRVDDPTNTVNSSANQLPANQNNLLSVVITLSGPSMRNQRRH